MTLQNSQILETNWTSRAKNIYARVPVRVFPPLFTKVLIHLSGFRIHFRFEELSPPLFLPNNFCFPCTKPMLISSGERVSDASRVQARSVVMAFLRC